MAATVTTDIEELAVVELMRALEGFESGTIGTVVSARPEHDLYTVEVVDAKGRAVGLIAAHADDMRVRIRPTS
ncbi:MAG: DUF4926 domain-containing protein [Actinobacteria bacterium]|nr:DUF4926 domain-containing protein [Actinomycetota bacterium]